jgi:hypothetical protein
MCTLLRSYLMGYLQDPTVRMGYTDLKATAAYALGLHHRLTLFPPILTETEINKALAK